MEILGKVRPTKRDYLKFMMSIFDPLGFLSPFSIQARFIFQGICKRGIKWDELINDSEFAAWKNWLSYFSQIVLTKLNRCYQLPSFQTKFAELHIVCVNVPTLQQLIGGFVGSVRSTMWHILFRKIGWLVLRQLQQFPDLNYKLL